MHSHFAITRAKTHVLQQDLKKSKLNSKHTHHYNDHSQVNPSQPASPLILRLHWSLSSQDRPVLSTSRLIQSHQVFTDHYPHRTGQYYPHPVWYNPTRSSLIIILTGQANTIHIPSDTIPPALLWTSSLSSSLIYQNSSLKPICTNKVPSSLGFSAQLHLLIAAPLCCTDIHCTYCQLYLWATTILYLQTKFQPQN